MSSEVTTVTMEIHDFRRQWHWLFAATPVAAIVAAALLVWGDRTPTRVQTRAIEPRLSGVAWAPFKPATYATPLTLPVAKTRGGQSDAIFMGGTVLMHHLVAGRHRQSLERLTAAAQSSSDARVWSDLAATRHETALRYDAPELLATALAAADRALELDPRFAEALFNRALILEHLGLRHAAGEAWTRYLSVDGSSEWAVEAQDHLSRLGPIEPFLDVLDREYDRVATSGAAAAALVARDAFGARAAGVKDVLGRWADAYLAGSAGARRHLEVARRLGFAVASHGGDHMLERAVAAIDGADDATRARLAEAHAGYRDGTRALGETHPVEAERALRRAADGFAEAHSPMVIPARLFAAIADFEQGHRDESERQAAELLGITPEEFPAYRASLLQHLGTCHLNRGDSGTAIQLLTQSASLFEQVHEVQKSAAVQASLAFLFDRIGDRATAWRRHVASLRGHGTKPSLELAKTMEMIAEAAMLRRDWQTASSFIALYVDIARQLHLHTPLAYRSLSRAMVRDRLGDAPGALSAMADAKASIARVTDPSYRNLLHVEELRATASLSGTSPAEAERLLSEAIGFLSARADRLDLPGLLLQRARARRAAGNDHGAIADLNRGIEELERQRDSLPEGEARWGAFHPAAELFDDAIDLAMTHGDADAAFRFAEKARARALLDSYGRSPILDWRRLPRATVVIEYVALPSRLIAFAVDSSGVRAESIAVTRDRLVREIDAFTRALRADRHDDAKRAAVIVHQRLVAPVASVLAGVPNVVFVPDAATSTVAFSALIDESGTYLGQRHTIVIAASAATFSAAAERRQRAPAPRTALLVSADQAAAGFGALRHLDAEMRKIAKSYPNAIHISDDAAQFDELVTRGPAADVIAFGGHAVGDERGYEPASLVLRQNGQERRVGVAEIAQLRLPRTSVVVLAGCSTARGERRAAEGVISVAHGFLSAGAPSVIATLWPIDDEAAATFFPRLHQHLGEGLPPAEALRQAQEESIRLGDVPASLWAAVQDIGS